MASPWMRAKKWHLENGGDIPFEALLGRFIAEGYVWSSPTEFVLAKEVRVEGRKMVDGPANCWFVHLASGDDPFKRFLEVAPKPHSLVCWNRRGKPRLHIYTWEKFKRRVNNGN